MSSRKWIFLILAVASVAGACNKAKELAEEAQEKINQGASEAKESIQKGVQGLRKEAEELADTARTKVGQQLDLAGSLTLSLDGINEQKGCYVDLTTLDSTTSGTRRNVLQLRSYPTVEQESFPAVLIYAQVSAGELAELVGTTVPARVFAQSETDGPVWYSPEGSDVEVRIESLTDGELRATIAGATLRSSEGGEQNGVDGQFVAVSNW